MASVTPEGSDDEDSVYFTPSDKPKHRPLARSRSSDISRPVAALESLLRATMEQRRRCIAPSEAEKSSVMTTAESCRAPADTTYDSFKPMSDVTYDSFISSDDQLVPDLTSDDVSDDVEGHVYDIIYQPPPYHTLTGDNSQLLDSALSQQLEVTENAQAFDSCAGPHITTLCRRKPTPENQATTTRRHTTTPGHITAPRHSVSTTERTTVDSIATPFKRITTLGNPIITPPYISSLRRSATTHGQINILSSKTTSEHKTPPGDSTTTPGVISNFGNLANAFGHIATQEHHITTPEQTTTFTHPGMTSGHHSKSPGGGESSYSQKNEKSGCVKVLNGHDKTPQVLFTATPGRHIINLGRRYTCPESMTAMSYHPKILGSHTTTPKSNKTTSEHFTTTLRYHTATPDSHVTTMGSPETTFGRHITTPESHIATPGHHAIVIKHNTTSPELHITRPVQHATTPELITTPQQHKTTPKLRITTPEQHKTTTAHHTTVIDVGGQEKAFVFYNDSLLGETDVDNDSLLGEIGADELSCYETPPLAPPVASLPLITVQSPTPVRKVLDSPEKKCLRHPEPVRILAAEAQGCSVQKSSRFSFLKRISSRKSGKPEVASSDRKLVKRSASALHGQCRRFRGMTPMQNLVLSRMENRVEMQTTKPRAVSDPHKKHKERQKSSGKASSLQRNQDQIVPDLLPNKQTSAFGRRIRVHAEVHRNASFCPHSVLNRSRSDPQSMSQLRRVSFTPKVIQKLFRSPNSMMNSPSCNSIPSLSTGAPSHEYHAVLTNDPVLNIDSPDCASQPTKLGKVLRTMCLIFAYMCVGLSFSILGPTLLDLSDYTATSVDKISQVFTSRGGGTMLGSIVSGIVFDHFNYYLTFAIVLVVSAVLNFVTPLVTSYAALMGLVFVSGVALGFLDAASQVLCVYIWGTDNAPYMQAMHFLYGIGSITGPAIAEPFLRTAGIGGVASDVRNMLTSAPTFYGNVTTIMYEVTDTDTDQTTILTSKQMESFRFGFAYFILASLFAISAILMFVTWAAGDRLKIRAPLLLVQSDAAIEEKPRSRRIYVIVFLISLFHFFHMGTEISYKGLISAFSTKALEWSRQNSAWLAAACYFNYTLGRGIGMVISKCISPVPIIVVNLVVMFASLVLELLFARQHEAVLWVTASMHGFGQSTVLPSSLTWLDELVDVNSRIAALLMFSACTGMMVIPGLVGWLMDTSSWYFVSLHLASVSIMIVVFALLYIYTRRTGTKYDQDEANYENKPIYRNRKSHSADVNNNEETPKAAMLREHCPQLEEIPEFTGSPIIYNTANTRYGVQASAELPPSSSRRRFSARRFSRRSVKSEGFSRRSLVKSPYSMRSYTPLILMSCLDS